jgi:hypothetical protein
MSESAASNAVIKVNHNAQLEIMTTVELVSTINFARIDESPKGAVKRIASDLLNSNICSSEQMLVQLVLACINEEDTQGYTKKLITIRLLLGYALLDMPPEEIVSSIAPYYETAKNNQLKKGLGDILDMASVRNGRHKPDYQAFTQYIDKNKLDPPKQLAGYMFRLNPDKALVELQKVYRPTKSMSAEYKEGDSIKGINEVAAGGKWWEELYAAEKMRQTPKLRDQKLIEQLKKSDNTAVLDVVHEIEKNIKYENKSKIPVQESE